MAQINFTLDFEQITEELLQSNLNNIIKGHIIAVMNAYMEAERDEIVNAGNKQKTEEREAVRNGYYEREYTIPIGTLNLKVPRTRNGEFSTELFEKYSRMDQSLVLMMMESVINGVSTRKVANIVETIAGKNISKSFVSNAMKRLDPEISEWAGRPLTHTSYNYLYVDAMYVKVRENHKIVSKAVYIAQAITKDNRRELIGFMVSGKETEEAWTEFFSNLRNRGLNDPKLVISDAHKGLKAAISSHFLDAPWQRCSVHFMRNIIKSMPKKGSEEPRNILRAIFKAPTIQHAKELKEEFISMIEDDKRFEKSLEIFENGFDDATQYFQFPTQHHVSIKSTNSLENINRQIRRRERVVGIFPNVDSVFRLIGAVLMDINETLELRPPFLKRSTNG